MFTMFKNKFKEKKYNVTLLYCNDLLSPYYVRARGSSKEQAVTNAKKFVANNVHFFGSPSHDLIMQRLSLKEIEEIAK